MKQYKRISKKVKNEANKLIESARFNKVPRFHVNKFGLNERATIETMVRMSVSHCKLQEAACNGELTPTQKRNELSLEASIEQIAESFGLTVTFDGDPRGFTVKLHSFKPGFYNTWGGQESGYGIGEH